MPSLRRAVTLLATAVAALAAPAGAQASAQTAACPGADLVPVAGNLPQVAQATLCLLNDERVDAGLRPLAEAPGLTRPSAAYSARMVAEGFFAHEAPDGSTLTDRLTGARYIDPDGAWIVGENLAWGQGDLATARNIMVAWMNSPGHRKNVLTPEYTEVGLGIVPGTPGDATWGATYTTDFGAVEGDETTAAVATAASAARTTTAKARPRARAAKRCTTTPARGRAASAKRSKKSAKARRVATCGARATRAARSGRAAR
jgi:uncharacterized protein YkwD